MTGTIDLPLFALARRTDPATSHTAASELAPKLNVLQQHMLAVLSASPVPLTAAEAARECVRVYGGMSESYRKRSGELVAKGLARVAGIKSCDVSGKVCRTFASLPSPSRGDV